MTTCCCLFSHIGAIRTSTSQEQQAKKPSALGLRLVFRLDGYTSPWSDRGFGSFFYITTARSRSRGMAAIPDDAACYFCLGDEEGKPLVRDCSCRGNSGFAHLSCLTNYAEQKSIGVREGDTAAFAEPWEICINCKQPFQCQLSIDLSSAFVSFAESSYGHPGNSKWDKLKVMESLRSKIKVMFNLCIIKVGKFDPNMKVEVFSPKIDRTEVSFIINELILIVDQTKKDLKMNNWVHLPHTSVEYQYYKFVCGHYEAFGYKSLGTNQVDTIMSLDNRAEEAVLVATKHYKKARAIYNLLDMKDVAMIVEVLISGINAWVLDDATLSATLSSVTRPMLQTLGNAYELNHNDEGSDSELNIKMGLNYAGALWTMVDRCIEAERIASKLAAVSRRVHGSEHIVTIEANAMLKKCMGRYVYVMPENKHFQALRYENDGQICVIMGPIANPRQEEEESVFHVASDLVLPGNGCPVICHGLVNSSHLNGELGLVSGSRNNKTGTRLLMNFEKKDIKPALIKLLNLRIAFELPSEE